MKKWFVLALVASMVAGVQAAEKEKPKGKPAGGGFGAMDADKDGSISQKEFVDAQQKRSEKAGKEFDEAKAAEMFAKKDKDGDGKLTPDEMAAAPEGQKKPEKKKPAPSEDDGESEE
jgi:Ca2+-binding EF-hand superfamily protein